jgi:hypothetical protein
MLAAAAIWAAPGPAIADERDTREAKERFEEGLARARTGDWEGARRSFQQSMAVVHSQAALFNLALAEEKCARPVEALTHFKEYEHRYSPEGDERVQAQRHIGELSAKVGHIEVQAPSGTVLTLDGSQSAGTAPLTEPLDVAPGHHTIVAKLAAGTQSLEVDAIAGQVRHLAFPLGGAAQPAPPVTTPGEDPLGGAPQGATPAPAPATAEQLPASGERNGARFVAVAAIGGAALVAGGLGLYFGAQSNSDGDRVSSLQKSPTCKSGCADLQSAVDSANSEHVISDGLFIGAGVLAAVAVGTLALWPRTPSASTSALRVVPVAGPTGAGVTAVGAF